MFSPALIEQYTPNSYRGTLYTHKRKFNETATGSKRFSVDRPAGFLQRADCDIGSQVVLEKDQIETTIPGAFHPSRVDTPITYLPHIPDADIDLPPFPLTQLTSQCRYKPEMSGEVYSSDPYELLHLAKILCPAEALQRRSKIDIAGYQWTTHAGAVHDDANAFGAYEWDWRVHPSNALVLKLGGGRLGGSQFNYLNPDDQLEIENTTSGEAFNHIRVEATLSQKGVVTFSTRRDILNIPISQITSVDPTFTAGHDPVEIKFLKFRIHTHKAVADSSGYAYFSSDDHTFSLGLEFVGGIIEYTDLTVEETFDAGDMIDTVFDSWSDDRGEDVHELHERVTRATTLEVPQCRFTLSHQQSIPGPGPRYGGGEDGIYYSSRLLSTLLPEDEYGMVSLMDKWKEGADPDYADHRTYSPADMVRNIFFPAVRSYYEFDLAGVPIMPDEDQTIQVVPATGTEGIILNAEPDGTYAALIRLVPAAGIDLIGYTTNPVQSDDDTHVTVHLPAGHGQNLVGAASFLGTNFAPTLTRAPAAGADPARLTWDETAVLMAADLFAEGGGRARILYTSETLYNLNSDEWIAIFAATHGVGAGGVPYVTLTDGDGNAIDPTVGADLADDGIFRVVQWPRYLDAAFAYFDEDLDGNGRPEFTAAISETLEAFMGAGQRRTHVVCDCREPVLIGPLTPWGTIECNRPLGKRTAFVPPRLSTYDLEVKFDSQITLGTWLARYNDAAVSLHTEFLSHAEDFAEQNILSCPLISKVLTVADGTTGDRYSFVVQNGPPSWLYITHFGEPSLQFTLEVGNRKSTTLESLDKFDQFKLLGRAAHPQSNFQYEDWKTTRRPILLRVEELGLFGEIKQWEEYIQFTLELLSDQMEIKVYTIYDHHVIRDEQMYTKLEFIN